MSSKPFDELFWSNDAEGGIHAVVAEATELGAEDCVGARGGGSEVDVDDLAGDSVLLKAEFGDGEAVDDILSVEAEVYFVVCRKD